MIGLRRVIPCLGIACLLATEARAVAPNLTFDELSVAGSPVAAGGTVLSTDQVLVKWTATDVETPAANLKIDMRASFDGGATYAFVTRATLGQTNSGTFTWFPTNKPTNAAIFEIRVTDGESLTTVVSSVTFKIASGPSAALLHTTLRDFEQPGTQPLGIQTDILAPSNCQAAACHSGTAPQTENVFRRWRGSMMAHATVDPLWQACLEVASSDAQESGDLCIRCHSARAWLSGRSNPTNGARILPAASPANYSGLQDKFGVTCDVCHRLVNPLGPTAEDPPALVAVDDPIRAALGQDLPVGFGTGNYVVDPNPGFKQRGPFFDIPLGHPHPTLSSPFHDSPKLCGTCHNVSNPIFVANGNGKFVLSADDHATEDLSPGKVVPIERTLSEWEASDFKTTGVRLAGDPYGPGLVRTCQDCHFRKATARACQVGLLRANQPQHDLSGGSAWLLPLLTKLSPYKDLAPADVAELQADLNDGAVRARATLGRAARLEGQTVFRNGQRLLRVTVTNETGHKLPTGYPEGRRMWINVRFFDSNQQLVGESGAYDASTGILDRTGAKVYEADLVTEGVPGIADGEHFHFVLANRIAKDNRIPPRGFKNGAFAAFGGKPVGATYANGQFWDDTLYPIPARAITARVVLNYQSMSKEYVEFLRDRAPAKGPQLYDLWANNGKAPPEPMEKIGVNLVKPPAIVVTGAGPGGGPHVRVLEAGTLRERFSFFPFTPSFRGGVQVAAGDVNGDGVPDVIVGSGPGIRAQVRTFDGRTGDPLPGTLGNFFPFPAGFSGGAFVAAGDVDFDGFDDVVVGAGAGGTPMVSVFSGKDGTPLTSLVAFDASFRGGVRVAAGDVNGDGFADVVATSGAGRRGVVRIFDGVSNEIVSNFFASPPEQTGGLFVAAEDVDRDGLADVVVGSGPGGAARCRIFAGKDGTLLRSFVAYDSAVSGGVRVAVSDVDGDGRLDVVTGPGDGSAPEVRSFDALTGARGPSFLAYTPGFTGGVFVGGAR